MLLLLLLLLLLLPVSPMCLRTIVRAVAVAG
jgi:hypothetical protein